MVGGPSVDPWMARHSQANGGCQAIHGWPGPSMDGLDPPLAPNRMYGLHLDLKFPLNPRVVLSQFSKATAKSRSETQANTTCMLENTPYTEHDLR